MSLGGRWVLLSFLFGAAVGARLAWEWQADELEKQAAGYERQLAQQDQAHGREREAAAGAALDQLQIQQAARRDLEDRLQLQDKTHWKEMNDAQQAQARLRDRLATADLRLSVLVDAGSVAAQGCGGGGRAPAGTGGVVDGALRAQLDPAHARRIVAITDEGDRGLIALKACQAYVREVTK
ncbi:MULTISPECIES: lysis system i-spanin subunit Rz [unclassified Pseudomonas]|uniref:lysis system i-spanin subunit Rz n=1 Tax=unclassified Pseudomonas TaxID=196821 RepID=UPI002096C25E|nr:MULTISPECIES: lysis system i-spanin subunit Rz [unclassified Pseudomonas]MCO7519191.1 lysis protein [Pseudomonas sp. 1]MCO7540145.1 lysis protein [Pseudomonas sp. VA159-2]